jgi:hypothetical protein
VASARGGRQHPAEEVISAARSRKWERLGGLGSFFKRERKREREREREKERERERERERDK